MSDLEPQQSFPEKLIEQDAGISQSSLQEQCMILHNTLKSLDETARSSQLFVIWTIAAVVVSGMFGLVFQEIQPWLPGNTEAIAVVISIASNVALIAAAVAVIRYWTIDRPQLERGRIDLQVAMFQDLQRQISEMRNR